uniref:RNase H type-1 domain-containing protein n=1 Tax=Fagus sylvatica TaxID=28930 RepID=A0A2N9FTX8_FAGSY
MRHIVGKLSTSSFQRYKVCANRSSDEGVMAPGSRGVGAVFVHSSDAKIPVKRGMLSANREFHDVAGVIIFPTHPGSRINLLRAGKTLRAKAAVREKKCVLLPARFFSNLVPVPDSRESELGLVRYGPASRVHRGVFGPFEGSFPIRIPADPDKFLAIREFHVVHGCVLFPMCPGSQINLLRVRKTLCASVATSVRKIPELSAKPYFVGLFSRAWPCTEASLGSRRYDPCERRPSECSLCQGCGLGIAKGTTNPYRVKLGFDCTNNMTEYEACIVGLQAALEFGAYELEVFGDSLLIVSQTNGEWQARDPKLIPYQRYISRLVPKFKLEISQAYCVCVEECMNVEAEIDDKPWYYDIKRFIQDREYPPRATENEKKYIRRMAFQFFLSGEILYKRTHDATLLRCVDAEEANRLIQEMHAGLNGSPCQRTLPGPEDHESWLLLVDNGEGLHQTCPDVPQMPDVSEQQERTSPISSHYGLAVAVLSLGNGCDWRVPSRMSLKSQVTRFVKNNIICRYGMPEMLITDNASNLNNRMMDQLCQQFKIPAPQLCSIPPKDERSRRSCQQKREEDSEQDDWRHYKDWHEHLPYALCAYRTSVRTSVGATPYSLVYGMEAVLPVEVEIPSLRILSQTQLEEAEWAQAPLYQRRIERAYNKKARPRTFQPGDLVLKKRNMALSDPRGKFAPSYEGPYVVKKAFSGGAIILADMDGEEFRSPINSDSVIKYHV